MGIILLIAGILVTADAAAVLIMLGFELGSVFALIMGVFMIFWGANYKAAKRAKGFLRFVKWIFKVFIIYTAAMSLFLAVYGAVDDADYGENYVVVLGSAVKNSRPQPLLSERIKTTAEYCGLNVDAAIIASGGQGFGENMPEAEVIDAYLTDKGVARERITTETNSRSTYENFIMSNEAVGGALTDASVVTVTNGFHVFRAKMCAQMCGISTHTLSAKTRWYMVPVSYIRESAAIIKMLVYYVPKHIGS